MGLWAYGPGTRRGVSIGREGGEERIALYAYGLGRGRKEVDVGDTKVSQQAKMVL